MGWVDKNGPMSMSARSHVTG